MKPRILDVGCGDHKQSGAIGVDIQRKRGVDVLASVDALPFRAASFSHAYMMEVLEHLPAPFLALRELARVTASVTVSIPNAMLYGRLVRWLVGKECDVSWDHKYLWGRAELRNLFAQTGWRIRAITYGNTHYHQPSRLRRTVEAMLPARLRYHSMVVDADFSPEKPCTPC
jgi:predicted SAM-dependent methyltransferase